MNKNDLDQYAENVGMVMASRLASLPLWWMTDPARAQKETNKMFAEKEDAFGEMQQQMLLAPATFWIEMWTGFLRGDSDGGFGRAMRAAERNITKPYTSRVGANRRRLAKG